MDDLNFDASPTEALIDIALRLPPLFALDHIVLGSFGSSPSVPFFSFKPEDITLLPEIDPKTQSNVTLNQLSLYNSGWPVLLNTIAFLLLVSSLFLSSSRMVTVYKYVILSTILFSWFQISVDNVTSNFQNTIDMVDVYENPSLLLDNYESSKQLIFHFISIIIFLTLRTKRLSDSVLIITLHLSSSFFPSFISNFITIEMHSPLKMTFVYSFILFPVAIGIAQGIIDAFEDVKKAIPLISEDFTWCQAVLRYHGFFALLESQWIRLRLPNLFQAFWSTKALILFSFWFKNVWFDSEADIVWTVIGKRLLLSNCETFISLFGSSAMIYFVCDAVGHVVMRWFIQVPEESDEKSVGSISAVLFFVLALQTGLTEINGDLRFVRLYQNLCLLLTANLHLLHNTLSQVLFWLSASRNNSFGRHVRALIACVCLAITSIVLAIVLLRTHTFGSWLFAVIAFCVEMVIKVILTLIVYSLFMFDAYRVNIWESLDDYVFYVRSLSNSVEFLFAILIFFNGIWILMYESGGRIRAFMVGVHLYFNIWLQAISGIRVILKRRKAAQKLGLLRNASAAQLAEFDDVCAICYQDLTSAKITACQHYFHATCLRKWLNIRETCPICQEIIFPTETPFTVQPNIYSELLPINENND